MSRKKDMQRLIRAYKDETGETEVDMKKVAAWSTTRGWPLPVPEDPLERLARQFADAAREEVRYDKGTGKPYRANHSIIQKHGGTQLHLWIDIDEAPRGQILKSLINRREQMIGDGLQLTYDADHWNSIHPDEEPIQIPMDFTLDIEWAKNSPNEDSEAA